MGQYGREHVTTGLLEQPTQDGVPAENTMQGPSFHVQCRHSDAGTIGHHQVQCEVFNQKVAIVLGRHERPATRRWESLSEN